MFSAALLARHLLNTVGDREEGEEMGQEQLMGYIVGTLNHGLSRPRGQTIELADTRYIRDISSHN